MTKSNLPTIQPQAFLDKWKPLSKELTKIRSIPDVFRSKTPGLSQIKKQYGHDFMVIYLALWINGINRFAGGSMKDDDCKESAESIFEDFYFLLVGDLKLIAQRLKKRKFIRVSGNEIYNEVETYFNERCQFAQENSEKQSTDHKSSLMVPELNDAQLHKLYSDNKKGVSLSVRPNLEKRTSERIAGREKDDNKNLTKFYKELRKQMPNPSENE